LLLDDPLTVRQVRVILAAVAVALVDQAATRHTVSVSSP
jgi:hypothetical protein